MEESSGSSENSENPESNHDFDTLEGKVLDRGDADESNDSEISDQTEHRLVCTGNYFSRTKSNDEHKNSKLVPESRNPEKSHRVRSEDGAVAIIYHKDERTGAIEVLLEQNPSDDKLENEPGKIRPIGGAIDIVDGKKEMSLEALARELDEELADGPAKGVILNALKETGKLHTILPADVHGTTALTYIYTIEVTSSKEWAKARRAYLTDDAGSSKLVSGRSLSQMKHQDFAYGLGETIFDIISEISKSNKVTIPIHRAHYPDYQNNFTLSNALNQSPVVLYASNKFAEVFRKAA